MPCLRSRVLSRRDSSADSSASMSESTAVIAMRNVRRQVPSLLQKSPVVSPVLLRYSTIEHCQKREWIDFAQREECVAAPVVQPSHCQLLLFISRSTARISFCGFGNSSTLRTVSL